MGIWALGNKMVPKAGVLIPVLGCSILYYIIDHYVQLQGWPPLNRLWIPVKASGRDFIVYWNRGQHPGCFWPDVGGRLLRGLQWSLRGWQLAEIITINMLEEVEDRSLRPEAGNVGF
jgi:hypothetical protein